MSSPPKKMRKSGGSTAVGSSVAQNQAAQTTEDDMVDDANMEEEIDPASMYEDEEGNLMLGQSSYDYFLSDIVNAMDSHCLTLCFTWCECTLVIVARISTFRLILLNLYFFNLKLGGYRVGDIYIPPPIKPYCSSESKGARLIITKIMNTNFKSYADDVPLGPFCHVNHIKFYYPYIGCVTVVF